jgi:hypothetical protein
MGFHRTNSIGYFVIVKPTTTVVERITYKCPQCSRKSSLLETDKFCSYHGVEIIKTVKHDTIKLDDPCQMVQDNEALYEKYDEDFLWSPEYGPEGIGIFNINVTEKSRHFDEDNYCTITSDNLVPPEMLPDAEVRINQFLNDFRNVYGEDSIELKYGFYNYDS